MMNEAQREYAVKKIEKYNSEIREKDEITLVNGAFLGCITLLATYALATKNICIFPPIVVGAIIDSYFLIKAMLKKAGLEQLSENLQNQLNLDDLEQVEGKVR